MEPGKKRSKAASGSRRRSTKRSSSGASPPLEQESISIVDDLVVFLTEALAMENASEDRLQSRIMETRIEASKVQLQRHLEETAKQKDRLKQLIIKLGGKLTEDKAILPVYSSPKSVIDLFGENKLSAYSELIKDREELVIENYEMTFYLVIVQIVEKAGLADVMQLLSQSIVEERSMALWLTTNIQSLIEGFPPSTAIPTIKLAEKKE